MASPTRRDSLSPSHDEPPHKKLRIESIASLPTPAGPGPVVDSESTNKIKPKQKKISKKSHKKNPPADSGSPEDVNLRDIISILGSKAVAQAEAEHREYTHPMPLYTDIELTVSGITSHGEAIAMLPAPHLPWAILVPFALPGETIIAKVYRHAKLHSYADLVKVVTPNTALRDDSLIKCKYFGTCGGCQYQMLSYETQLEFKKQVVEKAYMNFSALPAASIPPVQPTIPSPKQYAYRTKITPHFDAPPKSLVNARKAEGGEERTRKEWELRIGFDQKGRRSVMDIEDCPIASDVVNEGYRIARETVRSTIHTYKRGSTLLFRDSLPIPPNSVDVPAATNQTEVITTALDSDAQQHVCVTSHKATVRECVDTTLFDFPAGSFFQNNSSILGPLTKYVRDAIFASPLATPDYRRPTHLVDTYCGSGLFALTLSPYFSHVAGIEIDSNAIRFAKHNLKLNRLDAEEPNKHAFHAGKSEDIFASVLQNSKTPFPAEDTVVVIDPPRKGCDESFINQVISFGPAMLIYVSCNVHTQARDVGLFCREMEKSGSRYTLESLRGFDLFPQTAHVESVAVLRLVKPSPDPL